jgi:hypothetical protein
MIIEIQMMGLPGSLAEANLKGQEFIGHQREVIVGQFAQPLKIQRDAIRELKSGFFSQFLNLANHITDQASANQGIVQGQIKRNNFPAFS